MFESKKRNRKRGQAGVTLIEMLVVVTIIGLFVALVGLLAADFFVSRQYSKQLWLLLALCPVVLELSRRSVARGPDRERPGATLGRA